MPGLSHVDHVAFTVPDLDAAVAFFEEVLGAVELYRSTRGGDGPFMVENFRVHPDASFELSMLRLGPNINIELFQWSSVDKATTMPRPSDIGGHHLCVYVADVDAACAYLRDVPGVELLGAPKTVPAGPSPVASTRWTYVRTPWGLMLELVERSAVAAPPDFVGPPFHDSAVSR